MANLSTTYFSYKYWISNIDNKLTTNLHKTSLNNGFIKKILHNNFSQIKGPFFNSYDHVQEEQEPTLCDFNRYLCNLKIKIKTHYDLDTLLAFIVNGICYKLLNKILLSSFYQEKLTSFNTEN